MILKKQLLSQQNLNNAFLSKTDTNNQTIQSSLWVNGGKVTLKNTFMSDSENASYFRIDPQGNTVIIYDGVSNQQLSVYSSSGSENTYITTINQASNLSYGLIDIAGASTDHLEINTNSGKILKIGGIIRGTKYMSMGDTGNLNIDATLHIKSAEPRFNRMSQMQHTTGTNLDALNLIASKDSAGNDQWWSWGVSSGNAFRIAGGTNFPASTGLSINTSGNVGINVASPAYTLDVSGDGRITNQVLSQKFNMGNSTDFTNNSPWYGLGASNLVVDTSYTQGAVQLGGYYGIVIKTRGATHAFNNDRLGINTTAPGYQLHVNGDMYSASWVRVGGQQGLYFQDYGGGWNMTDATWVRSYGSKGIMIEKNTPALSNGSYDDGQLELKTNDLSHPRIGFHRAGSTAVALYHDGNDNSPLKMRTAGGVDYAIAVAGRKTIANLNDPTALGSGIYTNGGDGIPNPDGTVFQSGWFHVINSHHLDNNGFGGQIAFPLSPVGGQPLTDQMYYRNANGATWNQWKRLWDSHNLTVSSTAPASPATNDIWIS